VEWERCLNLARGWDGEEKREVGGLGVGGGGGACARCAEVFCEALCAVGEGFVDMVRVRVGSEVGCWVGTEWVLCREDGGGM
jgi:hypothetical protein